MLAIYKKDDDILFARRFDKYQDELFDYESALSWKDYPDWNKTDYVKERQADRALKDLDRIVFIYNPKSSEYEFYHHGKLLLSGILDQEDYDKACDSVYEEIQKANVRDTEIERKGEGSFIIRIPEEIMEIGFLEDKEYLARKFENLFAFLNEIGHCLPNDAAAKKFISILTEEEKEKLAWQLAIEGYNDVSLDKRLYHYQTNHFDREEEYDVVKVLNPPKAR